MPNELTRGLAAGREPHAVDHVIQPALECGEKVVTRDARQRRHLLEGVAELLLADAVDALDLLLLAELLRVLRRLAAAGRALAVLARRIRTTLDRTLLGEALGALEEELGSFAPTLLAARPCIPTHGSDSPTLGRTAAVVRNRRHVLDRLDLQAGRGERLDRRLAAGARTLHAHVHPLDAGRQAPRARTARPRRSRRTACSSWSP